MLGFEIAWIYPDKTIGAVSRGDAVIFFAKTSDPITPNIHWVFAPDIDLTYEILQHTCQLHGRTVVYLQRLHGLSKGGWL